VVGPNPCGEIPLESHEACNLSEIFLPNITDENEFGNVAELLFMANKAISNLRCWHPKTREVVDRNHRIGIGVTGFLQATHLNGDPDIFDAVYDHLEHVDTRISKDMNVAKSIKLTTVKPSGTMSLLAGVTPGVHAAFSPFYIRRITLRRERSAGGHLSEPRLPRRPEDQHRRLARPLHDDRGLPDRDPGGDAVR
jgi:ribonucleoside-triphosphate reductase